MEKSEHDSCFVFLYAMFQKGTTSRGTYVMKIKKKSLCVLTSKEGTISFVVDADEISAADEYTCNLCIFNESI